MAKKNEKLVVEDRKVDIEVKKKKAKNKGKSPIKALKIIITIIIIAALLYVFTSTREIETVTQKNYSNVQETIVQEPYTIIEEYQDTEPLGPPKCGNTVMNFTTAGPWINIASDNSIVCSFNLTNLEVKEGTWEYRAYFPGVGGNKYAKKTVEGGETSTFEFVFDSSVSVTLPCEVSVISLPSIERCYFPKETFYKVVTKTRNVTRYRNVTKQTVMPYSNETAAIKTVNRFFGYGMPSFGW